jgi:hypothetical protein
MKQLAKKVLSVDMISALGLDKCNNENTIEIMIIILLGENLSARA